MAGAKDPTEMRPAPSARLEPGTVVGESYVVSALLGRGGMGEVWAAQHLRLPGRRVALKVLHRHGADSAEAYARFRREAEIASRLGHPNIVEVLDFNTLPDGTPYLVLELLEGESLAERLARGRVPADEALSILRQVGSALQAAHLAGVVHRDLKPDNVFLCPSDAGGVVHHVAKVLDFGISKIQGSQTVVTQDSVLMGTPRYMAPEQAQGKNQEIDGRADVFALGVILYEMLAGEAPFVRDNIAMAIYAVVHEPHRPLRELAPEISESIAAAVDRALEKSPAKRFPDVASFVEAVTGRPLQSLRESTAKQPRVGTSAARALVTTPEAFAHTEAFSTPAGMTGGSAQRTQRLEGSDGSKANRTAATTVPGPVSVDRTTPAASPKRWLPVVIGAGLVAVAAAIVVTPRLRPRVRPGNTDARSAAATDAQEGRGLDARASLPTADASSAAAPHDVGSPTNVGKLADGASTPAITIKGDAPADAFAGKKGAKEGNGEKRSQAGPAAKPTPRDEPLPPALAAELAEAAAALARGEDAAAERIALHSFYIQTTSRGYAIAARVRCHRGDLGGVHAALSHVNAADRPAVLRDCAAHGLALR